MRRRQWGLIAVLIALLAFAFSASPALGRGGPPDDSEAVEVKNVRGKPVKVNGNDLTLWVFVHPERGGKGKKPKPPRDEGPSPYCDDGDQNAVVPSFAQSSPLTFNINDGSIPIDKQAAIGAIRDSFTAWDAVSGTDSDFFQVNDTGGASRPAADGNNSVGWLKLIPRKTLAATWTWTDQNGVVVESDIYFNAFHKWGVFSECDAQGRFEVGNIGVHEVGHAAGLDHLSDPNSYATLYPSGSKGEVRKQTLTAGDKSGYLAAGGK